MTTAIIGTGGIGSVIARQLASGSETLRLSSADKDSARRLATEIGRAAVAADSNRDAARGADAVVLALRFTVLKVVPRLTGFILELQQRAALAGEFRASLTGPGQDAQERGDGPGLAPVAG